MTRTVPQEYADAFACPSCEAQRLIPTKEKIIVCQQCLTGYRIVNGIPDFKLDHAISFKSQLNQKQRGLKAILTVMMGNEKDHSCEVLKRHCLVIGRLVSTASNMDVTIVSKVNPQAYINLDPHNQQLIEKYLSRQTKKETNVTRLNPLSPGAKVLGDFLRDPDFLLSDPSISKSHAVIYQDDVGVHLLDLYSKNGTYVNGYEVEACRLKNNDVVSVGTVSIKITLI